MLDWHAKIQPLTEGDKMEATMEVNALTALQTELDEVRKNREYWLSENGRIGSQIIDIINEIYDGNWTDVNDIAKSLSHVIDYEPKKEIKFTASIFFTGRLEVPADEYAEGSYDLTDLLSEAYVDINNGDVVIDAYEVENAEEN
jgi:predicted 2-oxoglutarate/Fe(II)-dependent dioxygenase YbiX